MRNAVERLEGWLLPEFYIPYSSPNSHIVYTLALLTGIR